MVPPSRHDRLVAIADQDVALAAEEGFRASVLHGSLDTPLEIARKAVACTWSASWLVVLAGADLLAAEGGLLTASLVPDRAASLFCLALVQRTDTVTDGVTRADERAWVAELATTFPAACKDAVRQLVMGQIEAGAQIVDGLDEFCRWEGIGALRRSLVPDLLASIPAPGPAFVSLRQVALAECDRGLVARIVGERLAATPNADARWPWLLFAWRLDPAPYEDAVIAACDGDKMAFKALMEDVGENHGFDGQTQVLLTSRHRAMVVRAAAPRYQPAPLPEGGWSPPTPYDRARIVHLHIDAIAADPAENAEAALVSLEADPSMGAHRDNLRHALAIWRRRARLERREVPSLALLARSLAGGPPATAAELHAFVIAHLQGMADVLRSDANGAWRAFWNVEAGKVLAARPENDCRDTLVRSLEARFEKAGYAQQTEARKAGDTRCDITVEGVGISLPIEVKCDWNPGLWTAWEHQLGDGYAKDARAYGYGVYIVFWFGPQRGNSRTVPGREDGPKPMNADDCQAALDHLMSGEAHRLKAVVVDASPVRGRRTDKSGVGQRIGPSLRSGNADD